MKWPTGNFKKHTTTRRQSITSIGTTCIVSSVVQSNTNYSKWNASWIIRLGKISIFWFGYLRWIISGYANNLCALVVFHVEYVKNPLPWEKWNRPWNSQIGSCLWFNRWYWKKNWKESYEIYNVVSIQTFLKVHVHVLNGKMRMEEHTNCENWYKFYLNEIFECPFQ